MGKFGQPLTVVAMRKELKSIDLDTDNCMSLLEYAVYHYKLSVDTLMSRPQGVNEDIDKAEAALEEVLAEIAKLEKKKRHKMNWIRFKLRIRCPFEKHWFLRKLHSE